MVENNITFKKFIPGLAWFFIVGMLTLMPGKEVPEVRWLNIPQLDKLVHIAMFGGLTLFFCLPYLKSNLTSKQKTTIFIRISLSMVIWGLIIEVIQEFFVAGRGFEWLDLVADSLGVLIAFWVCKKLLKYQKIQDKIPFY